MPLRRVCIEVQCRDAAFSDGYGNSIDRSSACYNSAQSLVLRVTDNCPCHYPNNAYSNSRWCACARPFISSADRLMAPMLLALPDVLNARCPLPVDAC